MKYKNWTLSDRKYPLFRGLKQTAVIDLQFFEGSSHVRCERRLDGGPARTPSKHFANAIVGNNLVVKQMSAPLVDARPLAHGGWWCAGTADRSAGDPHHSDPERPVRRHWRHRAASGSILRDVGRVLAQSAKVVRAEACGMRARRGDWASDVARGRQPVVGVGLSWRLS